MIYSDWITLIGIIVTIIGVIVTIYQAKKAFKSSQEAKKALAIVEFAVVSARLKLAQEHTRNVAPEKVSSRGFKIGNRIDSIREEFDSALVSLPKNGKGSKVREQLDTAQSALNAYNNSLQTAPDLIS